MTTFEVAAYLFLSPWTVKDWRKRRYGPEAIKLGRRLVCRLADVEAWISKCERSHR